MRAAVVFLAFVLIGVWGCSSSGSPRSDASSAVEPPLANLSGQLSESFDSLEHLSKTAKRIAVVRVERAETSVYERVPFTILTVRVEDLLHGELKDQRLTIVETGGIVDSGPRGARTEVTFEGVRVMKEGERWLVFLGDPGHVGPIGDGAYSVLGGYQGKLRIAQDSTLEFTGPDELRGGPEMQALRGLIGTPLADARNAVGQARTR